MVKSRSTAVLSLMGFMLVCNSSFSQVVSPLGEKGKDWDRLPPLTIKNGTVVEVNALNVTDPTLSGNTTSIEFFVNGKRITQRGGDVASTQFDVRLADDGTYDILIICHNTGANAKYCILSAKSEKGITFE
jgi:hypothetical protein